MIRRNPIWKLALAGLTALALGAPPALADETTTDQIDGKTIRKSERQRGKVLSAAKRFARRNPEKWQRLLPKGTDLGPASLPTTFLGDAGPVETVVDSALQSMLDLGWAELKSKDRENLARVYATGYELLPERFRAGLAEPALVAKLSAVRLTGHLLDLARLIERDFDSIRIEISESVMIPGLFANPIGSCSAEIGWESVGSDDESSSRCSILSYASGGIMSNVDFVLKDDLTCVKDQKRRGTCVAHAVMANVETMIQVLGGVPENLSEQNLYRWAEIQTDFSNRYVDGLNSDAVYDELDAQDYQLQHEDTWNYNQSSGRAAFNAATNQYASSCGVGYTGEMCTNFAFQSQEALINGVWTYTIPAQASNGWEILEWGNIPDYSSLGAPDLQIDLALLLLEDEYPLHLSFRVPNSFRSPDANGYVNHNPADPSPTGSHAVLAVGFVANSDLPAAAPLDPDGRGYVVIKNSWGTGYGDCGFSYLSTEFLRLWGTGYRYLVKNLR